MLCIKKKVQKRFSNASNTYESVAWVQKQACVFLVSQLKKCFPEFSPQTILDIGTGTGFVPQVLLCDYDHVQYTLNDISPKMIENVKRTFKDKPLFSFCLGDFEEIDFLPHDLIISNMSLQWANNLPVVLKKLFNVSQVCAFSSLMEGSFIEWQNFLLSYGISDVVQKYPSKEQIIAMVTQLFPHKFYFYEKSYETHFSSVSNFISYLKALGACSAHKRVSPGLLKKILRSSQVDLKVTYKVAFIFFKS